MWESGQPLISTLAVALLETQCLYNQHMLGLAREFIEILLPMPPIPVVPYRSPCSEHFPHSALPQHKHTQLLRAVEKPARNPGEQVVVLAMS